MKSEKLLQAIGMIGDDLIAEARTPFIPAVSHKKATKPQKERNVPDWNRYIAAAACLLIALILTVVGFHIVNNLPAVFFPNPTNPPLTQPPTTGPTNPTEPTEPQESIPGNLTVTTNSCTETLYPNAMLWSETYNDAGSWVSQSEETIDTILEWTDWEYVSKLPSLILYPPPRGQIQLQLPENAKLSDMRVCAQANHSKVENFPGTMEALLELGAGSWYVVANITWQGRYIENEDRYEQYSYAYLFAVSILQHFPDDNPQGSCGDNVNWALDIDSGTLTIFGTGPMEDFEYDPPWHEWRNFIHNVVIEPGITVIGNNAFRFCEGLFSVKLPDGLTRIGSYAFFSCNKLWDISLPDTLTQIGSSAFGYCTRLESIVIPDSVTQIYENLFFCCTNLTAVVLSPATTDIRDMAFSYSGITTISIPSTVKVIQSNAFENCTALQNVYISDLEAWCKINFWSSTSTPLYYGANLYCNGALVTDVDCELFGNYTFCGYRNLQSVIIAEGKTTIPYAAFWNCTNLKSIVIPNSVNTIEENAFKDCTQIKDVHFGGSSADRTDKMRILSGNECLTNATWHYAFTSTLLSYWHLFLLGAVVIAGGILLVIFIKKGFI